jgi:alpha-tubulin suppressor-like RCC1 family protein
MRLRAVRCVLIVACATISVAGCGLHSSSPSSSPTTRKSKIAAGADSGLALKSDGSLWAWGYGPLGLGKNLTRLRPTQVGVDSDWAVVACGWYHSLALKTDGSLWAWGLNVYGQLGLGDTKNRLTPTRVGVASDWAAVAGGEFYSLALKSDGSLWAWGVNDLAELGRGRPGSKPSLTPTRVGMANDWAAVASGEDFGLALKKDGSLWAWGDNVAGQLGLGNAADVIDSPTHVGTATDWAAIACGAENGLALKKDGSLWAWGGNDDGQLGLGDTIDRHSPTRVGTANDWAAVVGGGFQGLALKRDGSLWAWGNNYSGQLGLGDTRWAKSPTRVGSDNDWAVIASGADSSFALKTDGSLWAWGMNDKGQLGLGDTTNRDVPTRVPGWSQ